MPGNFYITLDQPLYEYMLSVSLREHPQMQALRAETSQLPRHGMQIAPEQGQFMQQLIQLSNAKRVLEIGVFTGYSSLAMALALPADGQIIACDVSEEFTSIASRYWLAAGVDHKISLQIRPALQTLDQLLADGQAGQFDLAFIDADKSNYEAYYERCLLLLRPGGLILVDNVLWDGYVIDPTRIDEDTEAIREINRKIHRDERVTISLVPIGDGVTMAIKR